MGGENDALSRAQRHPTFAPCPFCHAPVLLPRAIHRSRSRLGSVFLLPFGEYWRRKLPTLGSSGKQCTAVVDNSPQGSSNNRPETVSGRLPDAYVQATP